MDKKHNPFASNPELEERNAQLFSEMSAGQGAMATQSLIMESNVNMDRLDDFNNSGPTG